MLVLVQSRGYLDDQGVAVLVFGLVVLEVVQDHPCTTTNVTWAAKKWDGITR